MKKNQISSLLLLTLSLQSCGQKTSSDNNVNALLSSQMQLHGGAVTKEILIHTNAAKSPSQILSGNVMSNSGEAWTKEDKRIAERIEAERQKGLNSILKTYKTRNAEVLIDTATGVLELGGAAFGPVGAAVFSTSAKIGGGALKGAVKEYQDQEFGKALQSLNDKRDVQMFKLIYLTAAGMGRNISEGIHAGISPEVIKERISSYKKEILRSDSFTASELDSFLQHADDNILFGLVLGMLNNQVKLSSNTNHLVSELKELNSLIKDMGNSSKELLEKQNQMFNLIYSKYNEEEANLVMQTIFSKDATSARAALLSPDQLAYFKENPEKLKRFKSISDSDFASLIALDNSINKSYAYLKVTEQIATNLNVNSDVLLVFNKTGSALEAAKALTSFGITGNPLDALSAVASITSLFSKPKPDPRFTAIFENFKDIKMTLNQIQNQLSALNSRLDNVDDGIRTLIEQGRLNSELIVSRSNKEEKYCYSISSDLAKNEHLMNYNNFFREYSNGSNGRINDVDNCITNLLETFNMPAEHNMELFGEAYVHDQLESVARSKNDFSVSNKMSFVYENLAHFYEDKLIGSKFQTHNLLSPRAVLFNTDKLLSSSFLFDLANFDLSSRRWSLVAVSDIEKNIKQNQLSEKLLENALNIIDTAIVQQRLIDGNLRSDKMLNKFIYDREICSGATNTQIACLAGLNFVLAENLVINSLRKMIGADYFWAWSQLSSNNPDFLNEKLEHTALKVVWVGEGASSLFTGTRLTKNGFQDGPYVQLLSNPEVLIKLPDVDQLKNDGRLSVSSRVQNLQTYRIMLENELMERNIDKVLKPSEISSYHTKKIKMVLNE